MPRLFPRTAFPVGESSSFSRSAPRWGRSAVIRSRSCMAEGARSKPRRRKSGTRFTGGRTGRTGPTSRFPANRRRRARPGFPARSNLSAIRRRISETPNRTIRFRRRSAGLNGRIPIRPFLPEERPPNRHCCRSCRGTWKRSPPPEARLFRRVRSPKANAISSSMNWRISSLRLWPLRCRNRSKPRWPTPSNIPGRRMPPV